MRPTGKYVLILQDEAPMKEEAVLTTSGLVLDSESILLAAKELARDGKFRSEWGDTGVSNIKAETVERPNTGTIIFLGKAVNREEFDGGDRVQFAPHMFARVIHNGTELCLIREDYIVINFTKD